jgi:glycosyl transferase family 7 (putative galactosyltransferase)
MLIWYGFESRPIDPARPQARIAHNVEAAFSAAVLFRNEHFKRINGYPTAHWGWGYEDTDVQRRLALADLKVEHRKGTFAALDHRNEGYLAVQQPTPAHTRNLALLKSRWTPDGEPKYDWRQEGVNNIQFTITGRGRLALPPETRADIGAERIVVGFDHKPQQGLQLNEVSV